MWKCPRCETLNDQEQCIICGEPKPEETVVEAENGINEEKGSGRSNEKAQVKSANEKKHVAMPAADEAVNVEKSEVAAVKKEKKKKSANKIIIPAIIAILAILGAAAGITYAMGLWGNTPVETVVYPTDEESETFDVTEEVALEEPTEVIEYVEAETQSVPQIEVEPISPVQAKCSYCGSRAHTSANHPKCSYCGSRDHTSANHPKCSYCGSRDHMSANHPKCATCGSRDHTTVNHPKPKCDYCGSSAHTTNGHPKCGICGDLWHSTSAHPTQKCATCGSSDHSTWDHPAPSI